MHQPDDPGTYRGPERRSELRYYPHGNGNVVNNGNGSAKNWLLGVFGLLVVSGMGWIVESIDSQKAKEAEHYEEMIRRITTLETKMDFVITKHSK